MKVLDGRDPYKVPQIISVDDFDVVETWYDRYETKVVIYCARMEGEFVPVVAATNAYSKFDRFDYALCGSYKRVSGFTKWRKRFYPRALRSE